MLIWNAKINPFSWNFTKETDFVSLTEDPSTAMKLVSLVITLFNYSNTYIDIKQRVVKEAGGFPSASFFMSIYFLTCSANAK